MRPLQMSIAELHAYKGHLQSCIALKTCINAALHASIVGTYGYNAPLKRARAECKRAMEQRTDALTPLRSSLWHTQQHTGTSHSARPLRLPCVVARWCYNPLLVALGLAERRLRRRQPRDRHAERAARNIVQPCARKELD